MFLFNPLPGAQVREHNQISGFKITRNIPDISRDFVSGRGDNKLVACAIASRTLKLAAKNTLWGGNEIEVRDCGIPGYLE